MRGLRMWWRPKPAPTYTRMAPEEARAASAWGYSEARWLGLTDQERAYCRANITKAPRYVG